MYEHKPNTVTENDECTILWDMPIHTDREIQANRPDITVKDEELKQCYLIDMTVPSERNVSAKEVEKLSKYNDLETELMHQDVVQENFGHPCGIWSSWNNQERT